MLQFIIDKGGTGYDISGLVQKVTWSGRKNSPARSLQISVLDDPELGDSNRPNIDVYEGQKIIFSEDGNELFRGIIMSQSRSQDRMLNLTAYDNGIYLANNKGSFKFSKKTMTQIFMTVCKNYGIQRGETAAIKYQIKSLVKANTTIYDILCNALSKTYKATGERFFMISKKGQLHLIRRKENITKMVLETGAEDSNYGNLTQYAYSKDITGTRTRLLLLSRDGEKKASWKDKTLESKLGIMQDVQIPDDTLSKAKLKTQVVTMLEELKKPTETLNLTAIGISSIYTGMAVYVSIPEIGIGRTFYVDSDSHSWDGDFHTMKLTLNFANDLESINDQGETEQTKKEKKSAKKEAEKAIKDAGKNLKKKKALEKKVLSAANASEKAADASEKALKNAKKAKSETKASSFAKTCQTQATKSQTKYDQAVSYMASATEFMMKSQAGISKKAQYAIQQADAASRRAAAASEKAEEYL